MNTHNRDQARIYAEESQKAKTKETLKLVSWIFIGAIIFITVLIVIGG